ncbi:hypothetical protein EVAR_86281_1 [Eumeta japonica]|uniref:Uncharacterized protein n=1 Tax=Eumeta variegata TaxID=151549 RepID=A0A4C1UDB0_EUMVA|nr:hypothetical protein EVAR_86281_1 [Eumeta japonica]
MCARSSTYRVGSDEPSSRWKSHQTIINLALTRTSIEEYMQARASGQAHAKCAFTNFHKNALLRAFRYTSRPVKLPRGIFSGRRD